MNLLLKLRAAALFGGITFVLYGSAAGQGDKKATEGNATRRKIPLTSIYSTSFQEGLKVVSDGYRPQPDGSKKYSEAYGPELVQINRVALGLGASNTFLVRGNDITDAIKATNEVFVRWHSVDEPAAQRPSTKSEHVWLVVFLGVGPQGPRWTLESCEIAGSEIHFRYKRVPDPIAGFQHAFLAWVPLAQLTAGTYLLKLFDNDTRTPVLVRRVTIPKP